MKDVASALPSAPLPALIFGAHVTALGVLRHLARRGIQCYVVDRTSDIITRSRWYRPTERRLAETSDSDALTEFLESLSLRPAVLIPCSDRWTRAVAGLAPETREIYQASVPPRESVEQFLDKARFSVLVERLGIPHPRTMTLRTPADLDRASDEDLANGFLKPTDSERHYRLFGTKGSFVRSRKAATRLVEQGSAAGITFMLQDWIPGNMSKTVRIDGFVDATGTIRAMVARRQIRMDPPKLANTASAVTIPLDEVRAAAMTVRTLLAGVEYRGVFNVEFKVDDRDGQFKIIELNPRHAWYASPIASAGVDLAWMSYVDAQELPVATPAPYQTGRFSLYETMDAAALLRAWTSFHRPQGPVVKVWATGDRMVFWWSDPLPAVLDVGRAIQRRLRRALGRPIDG
jgi:D-aspartate ligase